MDTYELERKKSKYKTMKENVNNMLNILYNSDAVDNLSRAREYLKDYYFIDNVPYNSTELKNIKNDLVEAITNLKKIVSSINSSISSITDEIDEAKEKEES